MISGSDTHKTSSLPLPFINRFRSQHLEGDSKLLYFLFFTDNNRLCREGLYYPYYPTT